VWQTLRLLAFCILKDMGLPLDAKQLRPQVLWEENSLSLLALWVSGQKKRNVRAQERPESCQLGQFLACL